MMTHEIDNALLLHGEQDEMPTPAIRAILTDAICSGELARENDSLRAQVSALEEANQRVCDERDTYKSLCHQLESRLAGREFE